MQDTIDGHCVSRVFTAYRDRRVRLNTRRHCAISSIHGISPLGAHRLLLDPPDSGGLYPSFGHDIVALLQTRDKLLAFGANCDKYITAELRLLAPALTAPVSSRNNAHGTHP